MGSLLSTHSTSLFCILSTPSAAFWANWDICLSAWGIPSVPDVCRTMDGAEKLAGNLNRLNVPGVIFRPMYLKPFYSVGKGELLQGVQVHIMDFGKAPLSDLQFLVMQEVAALYPDPCRV